MIESILNSLTLAQAAGTATKAPVASSHMSAWLMFLFVVLVIVVPFVLGNLAARALRMKDISMKIGIIFFAVFLALTPFGWRIAQGKSPKDALRMGIDLAGGADLIFQIDTAKAAEDQKKVTPEVMQRLIGAVGRRLDPAAQEQITVRQVGNDRIEVIIPGGDREVVEQKKKQMTRLGSLEFAILANERKHRDIIRQAQVSPDPVLRQEGHVIAAWREVGWDEGKQGGARKQKPVFADQGSETVQREVERGGQKVRELLVIYEQPDKRVTGQYLTRAFQSQDKQGMPAVGFSFNAKGGGLFYRLTSEYGPMSDGFHSRLAILLDDQIHSAPQVNEPIRDSGIIEGRFTAREVNDLVNVLNAGALEVPLVSEPISELTISPTLGLDVQKKGMLAIVVSSLLVYGFMLIYYHFAGLVADLCLSLNLILLFGIMAVIDSAFTLPGLAGIALTIGIAVDSNVLIYERMREERERGSSLRMSIHNGFDRALSAIIDSNVTTLISAVILYMIGTDQIRGFAVTLFIGLVVSLFTVLYFGRLLFDIAEKKRWLKKLTMMRLFGHTDIDFIGKQKYAWCASGIIIIGGLICFAIRGSDNYDVDLSGGTMVTFQFTKPQSIEEVRKLLESQFHSISLERLTLEGEPQSGDSGKQFRIRTKDQDIEEVRSKVASALEGHDLYKVTMPSIGPIEPIAAAPAKKDVAANVDAPKFAGGHETDVGFSDEITTTTAHDSLLVALDKITTPDGKGRKYEKASDLFEFKGTAGSGVKAGQFDVQRFKTMKLEATATIAPADLKTALASMQQTMASSPAFDQVNKFEGGVAEEMKQKALLALGLSFVAMIVYLWFRFERIVYGLALVLAVVHDCLLVLGMIAVGSYLAQYVPFTRYLGLQNFMIDLNMIAAFMTIAGYSLNDTIVNFDRLREIKGKNPNITGPLVNLAVNQCLGRTFLTSWTVFMVVFVLYVWGGESLHGFAYALFCGMITGVYSTVYIASPAVLWIAGRQSAPAPKTATPARAAAVR
ncbi:MAG TPA: protein translocase subunit SecD [Planctomycetaceae bacterium]|jgi:SecD/SecF fusion protein|nr:protein translocase subunit SecD [Planctomycetaceae bacterium]